MTAEYTIAICTYNRADVLKLCLESIAQFKPEFLEVPVLVINNNCTDSTSQVVASFGGQLAIREVVEKNQGLSAARNRAFQECTTSYIIYLDDDAKVTQEWFKGLHKGLKDFANPDYFGGPYGPYYLVQKPVWFKDRYGSDHLQQERGPIREGDHISGGNMGWKVELIRACGGFSTELGMNGKKVAFGEETALLHRARTLFPEARGVFLPDMKMEHLVPEYKMDLRYCVKRFWNLGRDDFKSFPGRYPINVKTFAYEVALLGFLPVYYLFRNRERYPYWQNLFYEVGLWRVRFWGRVYTALLGR
ncbi:MAG: glycosyltransferase family 2 protein [Candidatus Sumerlaeia bacterium]|nr:glycosyltransferase family 2 protein [Candidatus Sumerlaeia bacterium]